MRAAELFSRDEIRAWTQPDDLRGLASVATDWALVGAALAAAAIWWNPLTVALAAITIGGRQLGLAVLAHECAHRSLFRTRWLNDVVGTWLCGAPVWLDLARYRVHHVDHHAFTGTDRDPDRGLVAPFPIRRAALVRKLVRDLVGATAARRIVGLLGMDLGLLSYTASTDTHRLPTPPALVLARNAARNLGPVVLTNGALLAILWAAGHPALYLVWAGAWCTTYSLVLRIRSVAEHAGTAPGADPLHNTRTTAASPVVRLLLAPHHVNYHLEHHLLPTVPHWRLPEVHARLAERGALGPHNTAPGYGAVLAQVVT